MSEHSEAEQFISELFEKYADGYDDFDCEAIISCFAFPTVIWQGDKGHIFEDAEELAENIEALLDVFDENGVTESLYELTNQHISGNAAYVSLDWQQEDGEGEPVFDFTCHYQLVKQGGRWGICSIINETD
ncbi:DUF4440 domain-containing protein [Polycladidibacter stylochi]|uniref:DUF4440 domain-containing protein n=1 Tax=Polycladidibacter stylochi TaxID=1807766 RepID=UPI00082C98DA|nr:nuclear transport factor 2 family protein [Pseudovibrio stylochi]